ncbi:MAG: glycosyltransferase family 4 protein [Gemmatimonadota bacterium]|nr:glycosyltransferase family 4 protein [Gemmatimonadota bacterium]MDE3171437.1 glycosyltransferase family 4 protein [Gemmatimonadota bacterium]MDE3215042.1 glycosyltransferase family 4 protein [Gemmatimonadota bacterium]
MTTGPALRILLLGDYPADPRLGSSKVYYKLREEFVRMGHECDLVLQPELGAWPRQSKLRWLLGPALAVRAVGRAGPRYDVIDAASAEGALIGLRRALSPADRTALVSRSHGLEHRNYHRLLEDAAAGLLRKGWHRRWWYPFARLSQVALAARLADRLIVLNAGDAEFAAARGWKPRNAIDLVAHGVSEQFLKEAPPPDAVRGRGLLFCGTWDDMKGVIYLAEAFSIVAASDPGARLTILGAHLPADAVRNRFAPHARDAVTVLPRVDEAEVMRAYRSHDGLVFPSTYEGFGMVVLEAMSQRLPVIGTPVGCIPALVRDGETGLVVPARATADLATAMRRVLGDPGLRRRMAEAAYRQAASYTWARTAGQTIDVYRAAISARRGTG